MDVADRKEAQQGVAWIMKEFGRLDILVNNGTVNTLEQRVTIDQFPLEEWKRVLRVDLDGLFMVSKAAPCLMIRQKCGRIINISSVLGLVPARLQCAFVAAKAGVVNLTRAMTLELAPHGILTNCVAPRSILTQGTEKLFYGEDGKFKEFMQALLAHIPLGRPGTVEEVASAVLFLAARESSCINGAMLTKELVT